MTDDQFRSLCNVFGFAPSRALRELLDTVAAQAQLDEREACAKSLQRHEAINRSDPQRP